MMRTSTSVTSILARSDETDSKEIFNRNGVPSASCRSASTGVDGDDELEAKTFYVKTTEMTESEWAFRKDDGSERL